MVFVALVDEKSSVAAFASASARIYGSDDAMTSPISGGRYSLTYALIAAVQ